MIDLDTLNTEQREAVLDTKNNLLILACAGSGKTKTITYKIAYEIEKGIVYPSKVCAVTFTNRAAKEMRDRLMSLLPDVDTSTMVVRTFHSLCASLLRRFGESIGLRRDFTIYDDDDSYQLLCSIDENEDKRMMRDISRTISKLKDLGIPPERAKCSYYSQYECFREYYRRYNELLQRSGNVDFGDLISRSVELLEKDEKAKKYCHDRFRLILVDEYQDSNTEQFRFLSLFVSPQSQLVAVGDDDQSIYSFRGAEIRNILSFRDDFKNVREIKLEKNYRSTNEILAPASALIKHNVHRHDKEIVSADGKSGAKPTLLISESGNMEARRIADIVRSIGNWDNTAVLYRTNAQSLPFETILTQYRIPYKVVGSLKFYDREEVKDAISFLRLLMNPYDRVAFERIINKPARKIGKKKVADIESRSDDMFLALSSFSSDNPSSSFDGARVFLCAWKNALDRLENNVNLGDVMKEALEETELMDYYRSESDRAQRDAKIENLSVLVSTLSQEEGSVDSILTAESAPVSMRDRLSSFLERLTLDTTVLGNNDNRDKEGVTLITMHNTKGLEYDTVFCAGLEDDLIPGKNSIDEKSIEEERRILYVAMTRARKRLYLSYAKTRLMWGDIKYEVPSRFLSDIPESLIDGDRRSSYSYKTTSYENVPSWAKRIDIKPKIKSDDKQLALEKGDRVKAEGKGEGTVIDVSSSGEKTILTVLYDSGRTMRYVAGHANIEKIE